MEIESNENSQLGNDTERPDIVIITGMSGAGRTEAMHTFEDLGYFCIDNLPPALLMNLVSLSGLPADSLRKLAIVCDSRGKEFFPELKNEIKKLSETNISYRIIFLDASDDALIRRYSENRRRHPLHVEGKGISSGIKRERELLSEIKEMSHVIIDSTGLRTSELRARIRELILGKDSLSKGLRIDVFSFGYKHGTPHDADILMDVRFLPNPFYIPELRSKTGLDQEVFDFVCSSKETKQFLESWFSLLDSILPGYVKEGKQHLAIGLGCTGGQHRSVVLARLSNEHLLERGYLSSLNHRDIALVQNA